MLNHCAEDRATTDVAELLSIDFSVPPVSGTIAAVEPLMGLLGTVTGLIGAFQRVESLANTFLYNIDDFSKVVAGTLSSRQHEAERAEQIVLEETQGYQRWREVAQMTPTIVALRERFRDVRAGVRHRHQERTATFAKCIRVHAQPPDGSRSPANALNAPAATSRFTASMSGAK